MNLHHQGKLNRILFNCIFTLSPCLTLTSHQQNTNGPLVSSQWVSTVFYELCWTSLFDCGSGSSFLSQVSFQHCCPHRSCNLGSGIQTLILLFPNWVLLLKSIGIGSSSQCKKSVSEKDEVVVRGQFPVVSGLN